jgi:ankyrin repeat protein
LLKAGADVNAAKDDMTIPLMFAVVFNCIDIVAMLLHAGVDVSATNKNASYCLL